VNAELLVVFRLGLGDADGAADTDLESGEENRKFLRLFLLFVACGFGPSSSSSSEASTMFRLRRFAGGAIADCTMGATMMQHLSASKGCSVCRRLAIDGFCASEEELRVTAAARLGGSRTSAGQACSAGTVDSVTTKLLGTEYSTWVAP